MMSRHSHYPKDAPAAKHDLLYPSWLAHLVTHNNHDGNHHNGHTTAAATNDAITTIEDLCQSLLQSSDPSKHHQHQHRHEKLATVYTYRDAPTRPKPLSRAPRIWNVCPSRLFFAATAHSSSHSSSSLLQTCRMAVKCPSAILRSNSNSDDDKSRRDATNSRSFSSFVRYLKRSRLVAVVACDSVGRIGFLVPPGDDDGGNGTTRDDDDENNYAAYFHYAPLRRFLPWCRTNYERNSVEREEDDDEEDEGGSWTPRCTPPPEEECLPRGWDGDLGGADETNGWDDDDDEDVEEEGEEAPPPHSSWTPRYTPPPETECLPKGWEGVAAPEEETANEPSSAPPPTNGNDDDDNFDGLWAPKATSDGDGDGDGDGWGAGTEGGCGWGAFGEISGHAATNDDAAAAGGDDWDAAGVGAWTTVADNHSNINNDNINNDNGTQIIMSKTQTQFHADQGAAAADAFYSGLTRKLDTRADSRLYHMRAFNGWVKATQIAELDPDTSARSSSSASSSSSAAKRRSRRSPMRVLDLACGKGGDLGKWTLHPRGMENYVGVDVARGSLVDAALRARRFLRPSNKKSSSSLRRCTFTLADLGHDVPGRKRSPRAKRMQRLLTWNGNDERPEDLDRDPVFRLREGGGVSESDKFDVVSIQFAIHYMMSTRTRARRFFHTVGSLLERGGNLIATTIDARVVAERLMGLGLDLHFDDEDRHAEVDAPENEERHGNGNKRRKVSEGDGATVRVGDGVCRLKFDTETLRRVFRPPGTPEDMFGLQYAFTLVEGSDHAAGVGEAVDLPEWLTPIPALTELAAEAGLELEYATNFHQFYEERKDPAKFPAAHNALYNMKVLNREGSISSQEWEVSRMYVAVKFRKVRESTIVLEEEEDLGEEEMMEEEEVS